MSSAKITALIVDDDKKSRELLEYYLMKIPEIEIIGSASGADEAYSMLLERVPDILFLDVEMPGKSGFDLLADLRKLSITPCIIFQTAFDKYAIEAIKNSAFDYLQKPVDRESILAALSRYRAQAKGHNLDDQIHNLLYHLDRHKKIRFNTRQGFIMIDPSEIIYCQADWSYTEIYQSNGKKEVVSMNIGKVEALLDPARFFRINRSVVINLGFLVSVDRKRHKCFLSLDGKDLELHLPVKQGKLLNNSLQDKIN